MPGKNVIRLVAKVSNESAFYSAFGNGRDVSGKCRGFTLLELLVVLTLMSVLLALLLPSIMRAREFARRAVCANNNAQIAIGHHVYASDNHGQIMSINLPAAWFVTQRSGYGGWADVRPFLLEYFADPHVFYCPSNTGRWLAPDPAFPGNQITHPGWNYPPPGQTADYYTDINYVLLAAHETSFVSGRLHFIPSNEPIANFINYAEDLPRIPDQLDHVDRPSETPVSADAMWGHYLTDLVGAVESGRFISGYIEYSSPGATWVASHYANFTSSPEGLNASFMDGSARWRAAEKIAPRAINSMGYSNYGYSYWY